MPTDDTISSLYQHHMVSHPRKACCANMTFVRVKSCNTALKWSLSSSFFFFLFWMEEWQITLSECRTLVGGQCMCVFSHCTHTFNELDHGHTVKKMFHLLTLGHLHVWDCTAHVCLYTLTYALIEMVLIGRWGMRLLRLMNPPPTKWILNEARESVWCQITPTV